MTGPKHLESGRQAEDLALKTLESRGLKLHTRNYCCPQGELDLVMTDAAGTLVLVEVRYRQEDSRGTAAETVGAAKQRKLILAAQHLLKTQPELKRRPLRFDVVAVTGSPHAVEWIQDAFQAD